MTGDTPFDLLVSGGDLFVDGRLERGDLGIRDGLVAERGHLAGRAAHERVDATGRLVVPGLVDLHTHVAWASSRLGINPDKMAAVSGVTTWVDAGTTGAGTYEGLLAHVVARTTVEIVPFLNFSYIGLDTAGMLTREVGELWDASFGDLRAVLRADAEHPGTIRGLKVRASANAIGDNARIVLPQARAAADELGVPLMLHVGMAPPVIEEVVGFLGAGDILTHCFHPHAGGRITDPAGRVKGVVADAVARGVVLDVGHGNASMSHQVARQAVAQGFAPRTISSDMHSEKSATMHSLLTVAETFLALGLPLADVLTAMTAAPATVLGRSDIGTLDVGTRADVAVLSVADGDETKRDTLGDELVLGTRLLHHLTLKDGRRVEAPQDGRTEFFASPWATKFGAAGSPQG